MDAQVRAEELRRRNKLSLTAGAAIVASLVVGTAATYRDALRVQPGHARAEASARLCDELLAAQPSEQGKLTRESLAKLHLAMQRQQRRAAELMPVARLLGEEEKHLVEYWLARLEGLPISAEKPLKDRLTVRDDGRLALDLSDTRVLDLSPLAGAPIAALNVSALENRSELTDIGPLRELALVELNISNTEVADLAPLREMQSLETLNLAGSKVTDLAALDELQLKSRGFQGCPISDLTPIRKMPLEEISLRQTRVADLAPLIGMPLTRLFLSGTSVSDLSPLVGLPLKDLYLDRCLSLSDLAPLTELPTLENLIVPKRKTNVETLRQHPRLQRIGYTLTGDAPMLPENTAQEFWKDYDRQGRLWTPTTVAIWHFDSGTDDWHSIASCELSSSCSHRRPAVRCLQADRFVSSFTKVGAQECNSVRDGARVT